MKTKLDKILIILLYIFVAFESQNLMAMNNANTNSIAKEAPAKVEMGDVTKQSKEYKAQRK